MRTAQKIIKAFALCLAGVIIISIVGGIISLVGLLGIVSGESFDQVEESTIWAEDVEQVAVRNLEIDVGVAKLEIVALSDIDKIQVRTNIEEIMSWEDNGTLRIVEKSHFAFFNFVGDQRLSVYVPRGYQFDNIQIKTGAGRLSVDELRAKRGKLELGAGHAEIRYLELSESAEIEGGAGAIEIEDAKLKNLDLDLGAGKTELTAQIIGNSKISSGVGRLELNLKQAPGGYRYTVDKGIGAVHIDGAKQGDDATYGDGDNLIELDCGVGSVEVKTVK